MMRLDTDPMTPGPRTGRDQPAAMPLLIQVPRVDEPRGHARSWRKEAAGHARPIRRPPARSMVAGSSRMSGRPRRRLRRGVRRAAWSLLVLAAMAGTFTLGWTTRGGSVPRLPLLRTAALDLEAAGRVPGLGGNDWSSPVPPAAEEADAVATAPVLAAPVADAEVPVIFRGYLLPDNNREEPAHEGS